MQTPDGAVAICLAPGFTPRGDSTRWARGQVGDSAYAWLSVRVLDSATAAEEWGTPPRPTTFRAPMDSMRTDAVRAESVVVRSARVDGTLIEVETARVSGGVAGLRRQPAIRAAWRVAGGRWVLAQGVSDQVTGLAALQAMLQTVHVTRSAPAT